MGQYENPTTKQYNFAPAAFTQAMITSFEKFHNMYLLRKEKEEEEERLADEFILGTGSNMLDTVEYYDRYTDANSDGVRTAVGNFVDFADEQNISKNQQSEYTRDFRQKISGINTSMKRVWVDGSDINSIDPTIEGYNDYKLIHNAIKSGNAVIDINFDKENGKFNGNILIPTGENEFKSYNSGQLDAIMSSVKEGSKAEVINGINADYDIISKIAAQFQAQDKSKKVYGRRDKHILDAVNGANISDKEMQYLWLTAGEENSLMSDDNKFISEGERTATFTNNEGEKESVIIDQTFFNKWMSADLKNKVIADINKDGVIDNDDKKLINIIHGIQKQQVKKHFIARAGLGVGYNPEPDETDPTITKLTQKEIQENKTRALLLNTSRDIAIYVGNEGLLIEEGFLNNVTIEGHGTSSTKQKGAQAEAIYNIMHSGGETHSISAFNKEEAVEKLMYKLEYDQLYKGQSDKMYKQIMKEITDQSAGHLSENINYTGQIAFLYDQGTQVVDKQKYITERKKIYDIRDPRSRQQLAYNIINAMGGIDEPTLKLEGAKYDKLAIVEKRERITITDPKDSSKVITLGDLAKRYNNASVEEQGEINRLTSKAHKTYLQEIINYRNYGTGGGKEVIEVKPIKGEGLNAFAKRHGVDPDEIKKLNNITGDKFLASKKYKVPVHKK